MPTASGKIVCMCMCWDDDRRATWEAIPSVQTLPDPLRNQTIDSACATELSTYNVTASDTTFGASDKLAQHNPAFRFDFR